LQIFRHFLCGQSAAGFSRGIFSRKKHAHRHFPSENGKNPPAGNTHKYFLDAKIVSPAPDLRGKKAAGGVGLESRRTAWVMTLAS
jgi:hypothetical protein